MIEISTDVARAVAELNQKAARLPRAIERGVERVATLAQQAKARKIGRTYARAIPFGKRSGRPLRKRSGDWQGGQVIENAGRFGRVIRTIGPAQVYEPVLADLPRSKDGTSLANAAASDTVQTIIPQVQPVFEQEVLNALDD